MSTSSRIWAYVQRRPLGTSTRPRGRAGRRPCGRSCRRWCRRAAGRRTCRRRRTGRRERQRIDSGRRRPLSMSCRHILRRSRARPATLRGWARPRNPLCDPRRYPGVMHDPRVLLDPATDAVRKLARRGYALDVATLEKLLSARNAAIQRGDEARAESQARGPVGEGRERRGAARAGGARPRAEGRGHGRRGRAPTALEAELQELLLGIPNLPADEAPDGASEDDAELVRSWGEPPELDFAPLDHVDLGERLGILDLAARHEARRARGSRCCAGRARRWSGRSRATSSTSPRPTATPSSRCPRWSTGPR